MNEINPTLKPKIYENHPVGVTKVVITKIVKFQQLNKKSGGMEDSLAILFESEKKNSLGKPFKLFVTASYFITERSKLGQLLVELGLDISKEINSNDLVGKTYDVVVHYKPGSKWPLLSSYSPSATQLPVDDYEYTPKFMQGNK